MANTNANTHLTLDERRIILVGITNGSTKTAIANTIGKDNSTVGKEIALHRTLSHKCKMPLECAAYKGCPYGRQCTTQCPEYVPFRCGRRDRSPGACNGCGNWNTCRFDKYTYSPEEAQHEYRLTLVDARLGVNLTSSEAKAIADTVGPLLEKGLSPYSILQIHPELGISEKTLYNYIEGGVLHEVAGIAALDLRRQVGRKISKKKSAQYKKRESRKYLKGRTYKDYLAYREENPFVFVVQMDTVYNDVTNGPFIQTFKFLSCSVMIAVFQEKKDSSTMVDGVNLLEKILGKELFRKYVHVLLTDRGTEFSDPEAMETAADGSRRTRVFYCDPMQSGQKGSLENNHVLLRYICPKGTDLKALGLVSQDALNLAISHIGSTPVESLCGRTPLEMAEFMNPDLFERLKAFGINKIDKDKVILKPFLLKGVVTNQQQ